MSFYYIHTVSKYFFLPDPDVLSMFSWNCSESLFLMVFWRPRTFISFVPSYFLCILVRFFYFEWQANFPILLAFFQSILRDFYGQRSLLTHWGRVTHICICNLGHHWFRQWIGACSAPSHCLNKCWNIVNWTRGNKLQWNLNRNLNIFIQESAFENVVCEISVSMC